MFSECDTPAMRRNAVRYAAEVSFGLLLCFGLKRVARPYVDALPDGVLRDAVALLPFVGVLAIAAACLRALLRMDEYGRRRLVGLLAAAGGLTMVLTLGYAMLEQAGWPRLSMISVSFMMVAAWLACCLGDMWSRWHHR